MSRNPPSSFLNKPFFIGLLMFCFLMFLTQYLSYERYLLLKTAELRDLNNEASSAKQRLQTALSYSLSTTQTLGFIVENYGVPRDFDSVASSLLRSNKFVDAVQLVQGGVITHVYPLKGNEVVIGYNILKDSARNTGAFRAIETKKFFWAGPIELKQGGAGIIGRQPLYKNGKFWGFSAVIIRLPNLLNAVGIDSDSNNGFSYQLSRLSPDKKYETPFLHNPQISKNVQKVSIDLPDVEWKLYVWHKSKSALFFVFTFSFLGLLLSFIGGLLSWFLARQPAQLNKLVEEKTAELNASQTDYRTTLERVSDAFVALDKNWRYTFLNDAALATHPESREKTLGKVIWDVHPEMKGTVFWDAYHQAMETGQAVEVEDYYPPMDTWFSVKVYPSPDGLTVFYKDITVTKKAQREIIREKNLSESIINSLPGAFYLYDQAGKFIRWNKNLETISGYSTEEVSKMHPLDFFHTDEKEFVREKIGEVFTKGMAEVEAPLFTKDHQKIQYYFNGHLANFDGKDYLIGMGIDITDRKKAEQEIVLEKNLSDSIINSLPGVFYLINVDGQMQRWNKNMETVSGYSSEEIRNMRARDFVAMGDQETVSANKALTLQKGASDFEAHFSTKQKQLLPYHFTGILSEYNNEPCLLGVGFDITERKKAEQETVLEKTLSESVINSLPGIFYLADLNGKLLRWNKNFETVSGYTTDQINKMRVREFVGMDDQQSILIKKEMTIQQGVSDMEASFLTVQKQKLPYHFTTVLSKYNGQPCLLGVGIDITERKKAEDALIKSTHELKERVKELNCLYRISEISNNHEFSTEEVLQQCVYIIPPSYQYPEITCARILFEGKTFLTKQFKETIWKQETDILIQEKCVGKIEVFYMEEKPTEQEGPFLKEERWLINSMSKVISTASERKKAEQEIVLANTALHNLSSHLQSVREEERTSISRELHDELGQQLTAIKMDIIWIGKKLNGNDVVLKKKIAESAALVDDTVKTIRRINTNLRPAILDDLGLFAALDWQAKEFSKRTGIICKIQFDHNEPVLDKNVNINIFRLFQETLTNVTKHAAASEVFAEMKTEDNKFVMTVNDNGNGFDADEVKDKKSFGILGMNERALAINGEIKITSAKGKGTTIQLTVPIIV